VTVSATAQALRPRTGPEIIDAAAPLLRRVYPASFVVWLAYCTVHDAVKMRYGVAVPNWAGYLLSGITSVFPYAVMLVMSSDAYLGRPIDLAVARVARRVIAVHVAYVIRMAGIVVGLICFVFPGIVFYTVTFAMMSVVVFEDCPPFRAVRRSEQLTHEDVGRTGLILGSIFLIMTLVGASVNVAYRMAVAHHLFAPPVLQAMFTLLRSLAGPLVPAVVIVLYYDLRIRKEGLDLELMARSMGPA
jgi:hypothetical protein